jgi:prepilin-type N-terminal cleavage/methylation domain-containing protein
VRRRGFTLLEIAVALGVLAVLAAAIAATVGGRRDRALARRAVQDAAAIAAAAERHFWRTGAWPPSLAALVPAELPAAVLDGNAWRMPFTLEASGRRVVVTTALPAPSVPADVPAASQSPGEPGWVLVSVQRVLDDGGGADALYEKRHLYQDGAP